MSIKLNFGGLFVLLSSKKKKLKKKFWSKNFKKKKKIVIEQTHQGKKSIIYPKQNQPQPDF